MKKLILITPLLFIGCEANPQPRLDVDRSPPAENPKPTVPVPVVSDRFKLKSEGIFQAGYNNHEREIIIVTDTQTKKQYLFITGCGGTELHMNDDTPIEE